MMDGKKLKDLLESKTVEYNRPDFIENDPISIPHLFSKKQDIEIAGFFASIFAWGNRTTIIRKSTELMKAMDNEPYDFCRNHSPRDLKKFPDFKHRTFNHTDLLYFLYFLQFHYKKNTSLESAFSKWMGPDDKTVENALKGFHDYFFSLEDVPVRTKKHIATPERNSTCKRLNMYLRWMVRKDKNRVDFGIWNKISPAQLICPVDLHVARVARRLKILRRKQTDWEAANELTAYLRKLDRLDPVKYDFALFNLGIMEKY